MNWSQLIADIQESGMTQNDIACAVSCSQNYISDLKTGKKGKRVSHEIAVGILNLHKQVMKNTVCQKHSL